MALRRNRSTTVGAFGRSTKYRKLEKLPTNAPLPSLLPEDDDDSFGIVYQTFIQCTLKEEGMMNFFSREVRKMLLSTKIGAIMFDSRKNKGEASRHLGRLTDLDCGNIFQRQMEVHYTGPGCELICEALIHSLFASLNQDITEHSKEFFYISEEQRKCIRAFFTANGCMKIPWEELKDVSPDSETGRRIIQRAMTSNAPEIAELRRLGQEHLQREDNYTPTPSSINPGIRPNEHFLRSFDDISNGRSHEAIIVFSLSDLEGNAVLRQSLECIHNAVYLTRAVVTSTEANLTQQDHFILSRIKIGMIGMIGDDNTCPIMRLQKLQVGSPFKLEMMVFKMHSGGQAGVIEAFYHEEFKLCRYKNEIFFLLLSDARLLYNEIYNLLSHNRGRLRELTMGNLSEHLSDLGTLDERLFRLDRVMRSITPLEEMTLPVLSQNRKTATLLSNASSRGTSLASREWSVLLWRLLTIAKDNGHLSGKELLVMLCQDQYLDINIGRSIDYIRHAVKRWFEPVLGIEMKEFMESNDVGNLICTQLSMTGYDSNLNHLEFDTLHPKWPFLLSNGNEISVHRKCNFRSTFIA